MDQVCAKGSAGPNVDPVALNQMVFQFSRQTALGQVSCSGVINVEVIASSSGKSQVQLGSSLVPPSGVPTVTKSAPVTIPPTVLQVVNGTVRVSGDVTITMQTLPGVLQALQQNRVVLPVGLNSMAGGFQGMGGMR